MIPEKYQNLPDHLKQLFEWGSPIKPGYSYRDWEDYLHHGFTDADIPNLLVLLNDFHLLEAPQDSNETWVPLYSWRILGQLKSVEAIASLIEISFDYPEDDAVISEVPTVLGMIGKPAIVPMAAMLLDKNEEEDQKITAANALAEIARQNPELREEVLNHFRQYLQAPDPDYYGHNGLLVAHLMNLKAVELIDEIRALYENDYADISVAGDIEEIEIELGFRTERSTPKPDYYDSASMKNLSQLLESAVSDTPAAYDWNNDPNVSKTVVRTTPKVGRNDPCPCGSGKKYKRCCMNS